MKKILFAAAAMLAVVTVIACDDDHDHDARDPHQDTFPSCEAIIDACHYVDVGEGEIHACHDLAHDSTSEEACAARKDECLALCASDAGGAADAGASTDASHAAAHDAAMHH